MSQKEGNSMRQKQFWFVVYRMPATLAMARRGRSSSMSSHLRCSKPGFLWALLAAMCMAPLLVGETVLHNFAPPRGFPPHAGVVRDSAGNLYGTTYGGGSANAGVVYKLDAAGHKTVLYSFTGGADGAYPSAGVVRDSAGNLYGTTTGGGSANEGVVYKLDPTGHDVAVISSRAQP
jgi:uncharacterized repeat protein (TIGR03803 family)